MVIEIVRPNQLQNKLLNYRFYADGVKLVKLEPDSTTIAYAPPHTKFVQVKVGWCSSPRFYLKNSQSQKLLVRNTTTGGVIKTLILPLFNVFFRRGKYLTVENFEKANTETEAK